MSFYENIRSALGKHLNWNKARLYCINSLIQGILFTRNVNLARISASNEVDDESEATDESRYRRFQRFFSDFVMPLEDIARLIRFKIPKPA